MGRRTRECRVCGERYEYCPTCSQDKYKPAWMVDFHEENCVKIWDICTRFNMELMSKEEAKEVEQESKEEPTKKEEANSMEDMSKEELIDKCI